MILDHDKGMCSKSALGSYQAVCVLDTPEQIRKMVMSAQTDSNQEIRR
jgi:tryptophanyl-tRNA synthetase